MKQLFSIQDGVLLSQADNSEKDLQQFICDNWKTLFAGYIFITQEFSIKGTVRPSGSSGRIDILAYNPVSRRLVVFELKKDYDKNVGYQAADYRYYVKRNFSTICLDAIQAYKAELPSKSNINDGEIEVVLVARKFNSSQISQAKTDNLVTLIEYSWYENDLLFLDYIHSDIPATKSSSPTPKQKANVADRIWKRIQKGTNKRKEDAKKMPNPSKREKQLEFLRIAHECIAAKDAKRLLHEAMQPKRKFYIENAERLLALEESENS